MKRITVLLVVTILPTMISAFSHGSGRDLGLREIIIATRAIAPMASPASKIKTTGDMETCYKVFRREVIQSIPLEENRFGFEPEVTVKVAKRNLRVYEVGISYSGRTYEEGKKIVWRDGVWALWCLLKYSIKERKVGRQEKSETRLAERSPEN